MRVHYLKHAPFEGVDHVGEWAQAHGCSIAETRLYAGESLPHADDLDLLVVLGGPMDVDEDARYPWLPAEKRFIVQMIRQEKKVLGLCLGSQLVAHALGARVYRNPQEEIGWFPIHLTPTGQACFPQLPVENTVFHWHGATFDLPDGAVHLASSVACANQMFAYGEHVIGIQFHPEATAEQIAVMLAQETLSPPDNYVQSREQIIAPQAHFETARHLLFTALERLLS